MDNSLLTQLADNPALLQAVKAAVQQEFGASPKDLDLSNEELGQRVRAREVGLQAVDRAFTKLLQAKTVDSRVESVNPAR